MPLLKFDEDDREALVDTIGEWLDEAAATELDFVKDKNITDVDTLLEVVGSHTERRRRLTALQERLKSA